MFSGSTMVVMTIAHGTPSAYSHHKCRCDLCVEAKRERDRAYYRKNADRVKARTLRYYEENREAVAEQRKTYRAANADRLAEVKRRYHAENAPAIRAKVREWKANNPDRVKANSARYRAAHREEVRERNLTYYRKLMAEDPERVRAKRRAWSKTKQGILSNRAARSKRRGAAYTSEALEWIASLVDPMCVYCGDMAVEIDHLTPLTRGGTGERSNLAPCCRRCNSRKGAMTRDEYESKLEGERNAEA